MSKRPKPLTPDPRQRYAPAEQSSCGTQSAHISLTLQSNTRLASTTTTPGRHPNRWPSTKKLGAAHCCLLTIVSTYQLDLVGPATRIRALEGNHRLHRKWEVFDAWKKRSVTANTAIARELAGWCWSLAAPLQQSQHRQGERMNAA